MKLLRKLDQRQPGVLPGIVDLASAEDRIERQQIGLRLILVQKRSVVNTTPRIGQWRNQSHIVLRGQSQKLLEIILPNSS